MEIVLVLKCFLDIEQYMLNLKCQFRYHPQRPQRASLAHVGSQVSTYFDVESPTLEDLR